MEVNIKENNLWPQVKFEYEFIIEIVLVMKDIPDKSIWIVTDPPMN